MKVRDIDYLKWINLYLTQPGLTTREIKTRQRVLTHFFLTYRNLDPESLEAFRKDLMKLTKHGRRNIYRAYEQVGVIAHFGDYLVEKGVIDTLPIIVASAHQNNKRLKGNTR